MADLRIGDIRLALGWSQHALARASGMSRRSLARYEDGTRSPTFAVLCQLATALNVPIQLLFSDTDIVPWSRLRRCPTCPQLCYESALTHRASRAQASPACAAPPYGEAGPC
jgi:transcriptional regulator with XRE-family HTH domain